MKGCSMLYGTYRFHCSLQGDALLPPYKGSTFRGAFGIALKRAVCVARTQECPGCLLAGRCIYARTFEAGTVDTQNRVKATPPVPYIIEPPLDTRTRFNQGEAFDFSLILLGEANASLPYFIYAFELMGEGGIGKKIAGKRPGYTLDSVSSGNDVIYDSISKKLRPSSAAAISLPAAAHDAPETVTLELLTPLRLKHHNELSSTLPFHLLVRALLRRISTLFGHFGSGEPPLDYKGLVAAAHHVETVASTLRWHDWERYSNRQEQAMLMGGLLGSVTYRGELAPFMPLLETCQLLHLGKQTSFGLGQYHLSSTVTGVRQ